jgi:hypothetical protein
MAQQKHKASDPCRIPVLNLDNNNDLQYVNEAMLEQKGYNFRRLSPIEEAQAIVSRRKRAIELAESKGVTPPELPPLPDRIQKILDAYNTGESDLIPPASDLGLDTDPQEKLPDVIMTKAGKPFKTEAAARTAMTAQDISVMDYIIQPVEGGFIITKV